MAYSFNYATGAVLPAMPALVKSAQNQEEYDQRVEQVRLSMASRQLSLQRAALKASRDDEYYRRKVQEEERAQRDRALLTQDLELARQEVNEVHQLGGMEAGEGVERPAGFVPFKARDGKSYWVPSRYSELKQQQADQRKELIRQEVNAIRQNGGVRASGVDAPKGYVVHDGLDGNRYFVPNNYYQVEQARADKTRSEISKMAVDGWERLGNGEEAAAGEVVIEGPDGESWVHRGIKPGTSIKAWDKYTSDQVSLLKGKQSEVLADMERTAKAREELTKRLTELKGRRVIAGREAVVAEEREAIEKQLKALPTRENFEAERRRLDEALQWWISRRGNPQATIPPEVLPSYSGGKVGGGKVGGAEAAGWRLQESGDGKVAVFFGGKGIGILPKEEVGRAQYILDNAGLENDVEMRRGLALHQHNAYLLDGIGDADGLKLYAKMIQLWGKGEQGAARQIDDHLFKKYGKAAMSAWERKHGQR